MYESKSMFDNFAINRLDRISIPAGVSGNLRRKMLNLYVPNRLSAKILWNMVQYLEPISRIIRLRTQTSGPSPRLEQFDWVRWTTEINQLLGGDRLIPAFYFPPQNHRKKCSALMFDSKGKPVTFAKIAWGEVDISQTLKEREAYLFCKNHVFRSFETLEILHHGEFEGRYYNLLSAFPPDVALAQKCWNKIYKLAWEELSSSSRAQVRLEDLKWWNQREMWNSSWIKAFDLVESQEPTSGYLFCSAHGDYSVWNARIRGNRLFLFDWEQFEKTAPLFLDPVYFILSSEVLLKKEKDYKTIAKAIDLGLNLSSYYQPQIPDLLLVFIYLRTQSPEKPLRKVIDDLTGMLVNQL
jgi:hypothetical protein